MYVTVSAGSGVPKRHRCAPSPACVDATRAPGPAWSAQVKKDVIKMTGRADADLTAKIRDAMDQVRGIRVQDPEVIPRSASGGRDAAKIAPESSHRIDSHRGSFRPVST